MDPLRKVEAIQDITLMLHEQARLADLNRPDEQVLCFTEDVVADYYGEQLHGTRCNPCIVGTGPQPLGRE